MAAPLTVGELSGVLDGVLRNVSEYMLPVIGGLSMLYLKRLVATLDQLKDSVIALNKDFSVLMTEYKGSKEKIDDHEDRIRNLECD